MRSITHLQHMDGYNRYARPTHTSQPRAVSVCCTTSIQLHDTAPKHGMHLPGGIFPKSIGTPCCLKNDRKLHTLPLNPLQPKITQHRPVEDLMCHCKLRASTRAWACQQTWTDEVVTRTAAIDIAGSKQLKDLKSINSIEPQTRSHRNAICNHIT